MADLASASESDRSQDRSDRSSDDDDDDDDNTWDDWVSESMEQRACKSLFDKEVLPSVADALAHDKSVHGFDLEQTCSRLSKSSCSFSVRDRKRRNRRARNAVC